MELLFESRLEISKIEGKLHFIQVKPELYPEPVLWPSSFTDYVGASIYGSVLHDGGRYRMWYQVWPKDWDGYNVSLVAYAESEDGIHWIKPKLNLVKYGDGHNNLCNLNFHSPSIFIDPEAPATHRYRATGYIDSHNAGWCLSQNGYYTAYSADGLNWKLDSAIPQWDGADVITSVYHPEHKCAIVAARKTPRIGGFPRRSIWNAKFCRGEWSKAWSALLPDEFDDMCATSRGFASGDYYGMGMLPAGRGTVGFLWQFRHNLPRTNGWEAGVFGAVDVSLVYQENLGDRWLHPFGRKDFITHGQLPWTNGGVYTSSCPVEVGDEHWLYFTGALYSHGWYVNDRGQIIKNRERELTKEGAQGSIGFARWCKNRLFGFCADPEGVLELNLGEVSQPLELLLNYKTVRAGSVRVELQGLSGYTLNNSVPLTGGSLSETVAWKTGTFIVPPSKGTPIIARIYMDCAEIYSYELKAI